MKKMVIMSLLGLAVFLGICEMVRGAINCPDGETPTTCSCDDCDQDACDDGTEGPFYCKFCERNGQAICSAPLGEFAVECLSCAIHCGHQRCLCPGCDDWLDSDEVMGQTLIAGWCGICDGPPNCTQDPQCGNCMHHCYHDSSENPDEPYPEYPPGGGGEDPSGGGETPPSVPGIYILEHHSGYMWVNDDDDANGDDTPRNLSGDCSDNRVNGVSDLIDFHDLVVHVSIPTDCIADDYDYYVLASPANAVKMLQTGFLNQNNYTNYLYDVIEGEALAAAPVSVGENVSTGSLFKIEGAALGSLTRSDHGYSTALLVEGILRADVEFRAIVKKTGTDEIVSQSNISTCKYRTVETFYNQINLRSVAEDPENGEPTVSLAEVEWGNDAKHFIFVHGYNVNETQARAWNSEVFKRLKWSGSKAKFHGVSWFGNHSQISVMNTTPQYHWNVIHSFVTAPFLASYIAEEMEGDITLAAHSLGNMLASSALAKYEETLVDRYFMIDAAVPMEAYSPDGTCDDMNMIHYEWGTFDHRLYASEWHTHFSDDDGRSNLHWHGLFQDITPICYNFYSSGEEVLETHLHDNMPSPTDLVYPVKGACAWALQEKLKGRMWFDSIIGTGSTSGGWGFNNDGDGYSWPVVTSQIQNPQLLTKPFFDNGEATDELRALFEPGVGAESVGSIYASAYRVGLLATFMPATSLPVGANHMNSLIDERNFDMNRMINGWPADRENLRWLHSDARDIPYLYNYKLYNKFVSEGGLK